jgi:hypothetical protein
MATGKPEEVGLSIIVVGQAAAATQAAPEGRVAAEKWNFITRFGDASVAVSTPS